MKNKLTIAFLEQQLRANNNDKWVRTFFYEDADGVHVRPLEDVPDDLIAVSEYLNMAGEMSSAGFNEGMLADSVIPGKEPERHLRNMAELYQLSAELGAIALNISKAEGAK